MHISARLLLAVAALAIAFPAFAEQVNASATGNSRVDTCAAAKKTAQTMCASGKVKKYEACDCEQGQFAGDKTWECAVDAECEPVPPQRTLIPTQQSAKLP